VPRPPVFRAISTGILAAFAVPPLKSPGRPSALRLVAMLLLAAACLAGAPALARDKADPIAITLSSRSVSLDDDDPKHDRVGRLRWRGGIEITASGARFGGLSSLQVSADGTRLLAISDRSEWLSADLVYDDAGRLTGLTGGQTAWLRGMNGKAMTSYIMKDSESLAFLDDGSLLLSFERTHRLWRYDVIDGRPTGSATAWPTPDGLAEAPSNGGLEALTELSDGGLLALTEDLDEGDAKTGFLWRHGAWSRLTYLPGPGFKPTGASRLPGSDDVLVLERRVSTFSGFHVRLVRLAAADIQPGARLRGEELARWGAPLTVDNFEGLSARRGADGEILIYMVSDDNFSLFQRTLLLMFALED
jgi:hypothetical protein